jgi:catechol-2,3-dioxygenase
MPLINTQEDIDMIHLEHINMVVSDIEASLAFYRAAFPHWRVREQGKGEWSGKPRTWLHFGDDYQYLAFGDNGERENRDLAGHQVGLAHLAFVTNNLDAVISRLGPKTVPKNPTVAISITWIPPALKWSSCSTSATCQRSGTSAVEIWKVKWALDSF